MYARQPSFRHVPIVCAWTAVSQPQVTGGAARTGTVLPLLTRNFTPVHETIPLVPSVRVTAWVASPP